MTESLKDLIQPSHETVAVEENPTSTEVTETETLESVGETEEAVEAVAEPSELDVLKAQLETTEKRLKDTQSFAQRTHQENLKRLNDDMESGTLSKEDYEAKLTELKSNDVNMSENPLADVAKQFDSEKELVVGVLGLDEAKAEEAIQAFNRTIQMDTNLQAQLLEVPANQRTKWILEKGTDLSSTVKLIDEQGGVLGAINHLKATQPDVEALTKKIRDEVMAELNNKPKPSMSSLGGVTEGKTNSSTPTSLKALIG